METQTEAGTPYLTIFSRNKVMREIILDRRMISIGRAPQNEVVIEDPAISAKHVVIEMVDADAVLEDCESTNGTKVNGQPVRKHFLRDGDVIELGHYKIRFWCTCPGHDVPHI